MAIVALVVVSLLHPKHDVRTMTEEQIDAIMPKPPEIEAMPNTPAGRLDAFRGWVWLAIALLAYPLGHSIATVGFGVSWTINAYNTVFLCIALMLHGRPLSFLRACREGVDAAWGIIVQFPFYAGIFGLMQATALGGWLESLEGTGSSGTDINTQQNCWGNICDVNACLDALVATGSPTGYAADAADVSLLPAPALGDPSRR